MLMCFAVFSPEEWLRWSPPELNDPDNPKLVRVNFGLKNVRLKTSEALKFRTPIAEGMNIW